MTLESLDTTMARYNRNAAAEAWDGHRAGCTMCSSTRKGHELCRRGGILKTNLGRADAELKRQKDLDAQPNPNQETLL